MYKESCSEQNGKGRLTEAGKISDNSSEERIADLFSMLHHQKDANNVPEMIKTCNTITEVVSNMEKITDTTSFVTAQIPFLCLCNLRMANELELVLSTLRMANSLTNFENTFEGIFYSCDDFVSILFDMLSSDNPMILSEVIIILSHFIRHSLRAKALANSILGIQGFYNLYSKFPDELYDSFSYFLFIFTKYALSQKDRLFVMGIIGQLYEKNNGEYTLRIICTLSNVLKKWEKKLDEETLNKSNAVALINFVLNEAPLDQEEILMRACDCVTLLARLDVIPPIDYERVKTITTEEHVTEKVRFAAFNTIMELLRHESSELIGLEYISNLSLNLDNVAFNVRTTMIHIIIGFGLVSTFEVLDEMVNRGLLDLIADFLQDVYPDQIVSNAMYLLRVLADEYTRNDNAEFLGLKLCPASEEGSDDIEANNIIPMLNDIEYSDNKDLAKEASETNELLKELPNIKSEKN